MSEQSPVVDSFGGGVDSTAMIIGQVRRGERVDRILFADTGNPEEESEKRATYDHVARFSAWLQDQGYPAVETVRRVASRVTYRSLEGNCLANETLPSLSFGYRRCSVKWKHEAMDRVLEGCRRGPNKAPPSPESIEASLLGVPIIRCIGYDAGEAERGRGKKCGDLIREDARGLYRYRYPLVEWGWDRERCKAEIRAAGLPVPPKSACFFCPASKAWEIAELRATEPEKLSRALAMESKARWGKHGLTKVAGLGGNGCRGRKGPNTESWVVFVEETGLLQMSRPEAQAFADRLRLEDGEPCSTAF